MGHRGNGLTGALNAEDLSNSILQNNQVNSNSILQGTALGDTLTNNVVGTLALQNENTLADMSVVGERELGVIGTV